MKIQTFSVVVGGDACNAKCPYCVSKLTGSKNGLEVGQKPMEINKRNFDKACRFAQMSGVSTVLLTGKGEPLLYKEHITRYLELLEKWNFPFIELQTNGILIKDIPEKLLKEWYDSGLTTISLSCVHFYPKKNVDIFGEKIHLSNNIQKLHKVGFSVRISCVMIDGYIDNLRDVREFVGWCKIRNVEQFTIRPVTNISYEETKDNDIKKEIYNWIEGNNTETICNLGMEIKSWFNDSKNATLLLKLAHGAKVYDYNGQNISINSCLTSSTDPNDIRQLIFSSDGHLRFDWTREGAIII